MKTLIVRSRGDLSGLGLNLDLYNHTSEQNHRTADSRLETRTSKTRMGRGCFALSQSALVHHKTLASDIASVVSQILCQSETLDFLSLRSIHFSPPDIQSLTDSIYRSVSLRTLHFCNVPLGDAGFASLCRALKKQSVLELRCRKCGITDRGAESLHSLISYHVSIQGDVRWHNSLSGRVPSPVVCLQHLDLRDNELTVATICEIGDSLLDLPLKVLDLRGNAGLSASVVARLAREIPSTDIRTGPCPAIKQSKRRRKPYRSKIGQKMEASEKKETLKENNGRQGKDEKAEGNEEVVELEPGLTIAGRRARELAAYLGQLDRFMQRAKFGVPSFFASQGGDAPAKAPKKTFKKRRASAPRRRAA
jgi:hypothetical protein